MKQFMLNSKPGLPTRVATFVPAGSAQDLVKYDTRQATAGTAHCSGAERTDDTFLTTRFLWWRFLCRTPTPMTSMLTITSSDAGTRDVS